MFMVDLLALKLDSLDCLFSLASLVYVPYPKGLDSPFPQTLLSPDQEVLETNYVLDNCVPDPSSGLGGGLSQ